MGIRRALMGCRAIPFDDEALEKWGKDAGNLAREKVTFRLAISTNIEVPGKDGFVTCFLFQ